MIRLITLILEYVLFVNQLLNVLLVMEQASAVQLAIALLILTRLVSAVYFAQILVIALIATRLDSVMNVPQVSIQETVLQAV